jgi:CheY-like chemotaxis protein
MAPSVLIIDDDAGNRAAIAAALTRLGYLTATAADGRAGLDAFNADPVDLVITDIFMPERDGIEVIMALRGNLFIPKIIAMSGGGVLCGMDVLRIAELLGADRSITKPVDLSKLTDMVADVLAEARNPIVLRNLGPAVVARPAAA